MSHIQPSTADMIAPDTEVKITVPTIGKTVMIYDVENRAHIPATVIAKDSQNPLIIAVIPLYGVTSVANIKKKYGRLDESDTDITPQEQIEMLTIASECEKKGKPAVIGLSDQIYFAYHEALNPDIGLLPVEDDQGNITGYRNWFDWTTDNVDNTNFSESLDKYHERKMLKDGKLEAYPIRWKHLAHYIHKVRVNISTGVIQND